MNKEPLAATQDVSRTERRKLAAGNFRMMILATAGLAATAAALRAASDDHKGIGLFVSILALVTALALPLVAVANYLEFREAGPPRAAKFLFILVPKIVREDALGDLVEEFEIVKKDFGAPRAAAWFWFQIVSTIAIYACRGLLAIIHGPKG